MMDQTMEDHSAKFGLVGFLLGVASLLVVLVQLSAIFEAPEPSGASVIGEIAVDIKDAAQRALTGQPAAEPTPQPEYGLFITVAGLGLAGIAVALGGIGLYRNEPYRLSYLAVGTGLSAIVMVFVFWLAIVICGMVLIVAIVRNLDSILE